MDPKHDQSTNEALPMRSKSSNPNGQPEPAAEMKIRKPEEDVLDVIESVESQLGALRKAHEDHRRIMQNLNEQKQSLHQQGDELEQREQELTSREVELAEMRQQFEQREMDIVQRASGLEQRESKMVAQAESLEQHEAELESRTQEIQRKIAELDEQLAGITHRKGELDRLDKEIKLKLEREDEASRMLETAITELEQARAELGEQDAKVDQLSTEFHKLQKLHDETSSELKSAVSKLRGREIELEERSKALEEIAEKAGDIQHELGDTRNQYESRISDTEAAMVKLQEQFTREQQVSTGLRAQLETLEQSKSAENEARVAELQGQLDEAIARVESLEQDGHQRSDEDQERIDTLSTELENARGQLAELNAQLASIGAEADEELTKQREQSSELEFQVGTLQSELEQSQSMVAELQSQIEATPEVDSELVSGLQSDLEQATARTDELQGSIEKRESQLEELALRIKSLETELQEAHDNANASGAELEEQAKKKIDALETQCSELISTVERLNADLEEAREQPKGEISDEMSDRRRTRLRRMRKLLKGDAEKLRLANDALRTRYEQCEQVLTKRSELAEAYEAIASAQRKVRNKEVRSGVFVGLFAMVAIVMMLGVSSWFIAGRVAPGLYSSRATLTATSPEGKLSEGDLAAWDSYITGLTADPRFLEVAAERMKRRGIRAFSTPGELGQHMEASLDIAASMPGEVVLEYRDNGAERTQRVLDTFTVALSSAANNARARRVDTAITSVEQSASLSSTPLDSLRLNMSGIIFGGSMLISLIVGGMIWKRLAAAKARFENDSRVEVLFEEEAWTMPNS